MGVRLSMPNRKTSVIRNGLDSWFVGFRGDGVVYETVYDAYLLLSNSAQNAEKPRRATLLAETYPGKVAQGGGWAKSARPSSAPGGARKFGAD